jgi:hypothetical protein
MTCPNRTLHRCAKRTRRRAAVAETPLIDIHFFKFSLQRQCNKLPRKPMMPQSHPMGRLAEVHSVSENHTCRCHTQIRHPLCVSELYKTGIHTQNWRGVSKGGGAENRPAVCSSTALHHVARPRSATCAMESRSLAARAHRAGRTAAPCQRSSSFEL